MAEKKRPIYFWLKFDNNFYKNLAIKKARRLAGGDTMVVIYQKLMLASLGTSGVIYYEGEFGSLTEELSLLIDEEAEQVSMTMAFFQKSGLIQIDDNDNVEMLQVPALLDQETNWARYKREQRRKDNLDNVQLMSNDRPTELDIDIDIDIEKELDTEKEINKKAKAYQTVVRMFENNGFGLIGGIVATNINNELDDFVQDNDYEEASNVISKAIEISVNRGKNNFGYVWGITKNWYQKKLYTVSAIEATEKKNNSDQQEINAYKKKQDNLEHQSKMSSRLNDFEKVIEIYTEYFGLEKLPVYMRDTPNADNDEIWELLLGGDKKTYDRLKERVESHV